jgi:hypothetical protein
VKVQLVGGPQDGQEVDVPTGTQEVLVPLNLHEVLDWSGFMGDAEPPRTGEIKVGRYRWRRDRWWPYRGYKFYYEGQV